jgi:hypothetical protein
MQGISIQRKFNLTNTQIKAENFLQAQENSQTMGEVKN